jgi:hypothetical protein
MILVVTPDIAWAQGGGRGFFGRGNAAFLLAQESVQKELKLSEEQVQKVQDLAAKMRESFKEAFALEGDERTKKLQELAKENEKSVADILNAEQAKRLKQIVYQQQGASAFSDAEVAKALALTDDQREEVKKINDDTAAQTRELFSGGGLDEEGRKKLQELRTAASDKIMKLLTDEQRTKWKDLQGEPFKGEIRFGRKKEA